MGSGPDEEYLKSIAKGNIVFIWRIQDPVEKSKIIQNAKWLINITKESFGICTAEALLAGVPVFAYNDWASVELVDSDSGILVPNKNHETLIKSFSQFVEKSRDRQKIQDNIKVLLGSN
jgi:glycosyltransferase involved in cell wall biosynthesis